MSISLNPFFKPAGVAVIGASANPNKLSHGILRNLMQYGYRGPIYPVNPGSSQILGFPCYADILQVPDPVELAVIVVPATATPQILRDCGERGIKASIVISGGFKELGDEGTLLEKECAEIACSQNMRLIGPNCVGTMDLFSGLNTTFIQGIPVTGGIGFVSQSGAVCGAAIDYIQRKGVGFSYFISLGNEADVTETDIIEYLAQDANTRVIAAYVEGIQDGQRFFETAKQITREKPIVLLKAGRTQAGAKAVSSHTGSIAGSHAAYQAAFKQSGVIEVRNAAELFDIAMALDFQELPNGEGVAIVTNAGGPAALASDSLSENGFRLARLETSTEKRLKSVLNPSAQVSNPIDMLGGASPAEYQFAIETLLSDPQVDVILPILVPQALVDPLEVAKSIAKAAAHTQKTVLVCLMGEESVVQARSFLHQNRIPVFTFPSSVGPVLKRMKEYREFKQKDISGKRSLLDVAKTPVERILQERKGSSLGEVATRELFRAYGIPVIYGAHASTLEEVMDISNNIPGPIAMKIVSPDILHKSESGGIKLNVSGELEIRKAYESILENVASYNPEARIEGVFIEAMAPQGSEVIVGMRRDASFGPLLMFGLGGIYVELFKDVGFRIAPLTYNEAREMVMATKAGKIFEGFRGQPPADIDAVVDCILRISQLACDFPEIEEIEINPLLVRSAGDGVLALDGRTILHGGSI